MLFDILEYAYGILIKIIGAIIVFYSMYLFFNTWDSDDLEFLEKMLRMTIYFVGAQFGAKVYRSSEVWIVHIKLEKSDMDIYI